MKFLYTAVDNVMKFLAMCRFACHLTDGVEICMNTFMQQCAKHFRVRRNTRMNYYAVHSVNALWSFRNFAMTGNSLTTTAVRDAMPFDEPRPNRQPAVEDVFIEESQ